MIIRAYTQFDICERIYHLRSEKSSARSIFEGGLRHFGMSSEASYADDGLYDVLVCAVEGTLRVIFGSRCA